jgi:hypothetical protein
MKKEDCIGCREDFYNGKNDLGVGECWSFKTAKVVTLYQIGYHTPMDRTENFQKVKRPSCYRQSGMVFMQQLPEHLRVARRAPDQPASTQREGA